MIADGSKSNPAEDDYSDNPSLDVGHKNAMPTPPSKPQKEYLEDFENFTVK